MITIDGDGGQGFVDTAPILEKPVAERAGIGWQGKHTNLVSRRFGSWLFLSEILTTLVIEPDGPETDHCGSCDACLRACPTDAFPTLCLDARRCISYLTIEHKGAIAPELMAKMGNQAYGCDDCLTACPGQISSLMPNRSFAPGPKQRTRTLKNSPNWTTRPPGTFPRLAHQTNRTERFARNVAIAMANSGDVSNRPVLEKLRNNESLPFAKPPPGPLTVFPETPGNGRHEFISSHSRRLPFIRASAWAADTPGAGAGSADCDGCPEMLVVPAGAFAMGANSRHGNERPAHDVALPLFAMSRSEITFDNYRACVDDGGCAIMPDDHKWGRGVDR